LCERPYGVVNRERARDGPRTFLGAGLRPFGRRTGCGSRRRVGCSAPRSCAGDPASRSRMVRGCARVGPGGSYAVANRRSRPGGGPRDAETLTGLGLGPPRAGIAPGSPFMGMTVTVTLGDDEPLHSRTSSRRAFSWRGVRARLVGGFETIPRRAGRLSSTNFWRVSRGPHGHLRGRRHGANRP
jgi:hypothetical protein